MDVLRLSAALHVAGDLLLREELETELEPRENSDFQPSGDLLEPPRLRDGNSITVWYSFGKQEGPPPIEQDENESIISRVHESKVEHDVTNIHG